MNKYNILSLTATVTAILLITYFFLSGLFKSVGAGDVCPHGGEWSEHQEPPFMEVEGTIEYCWKGGSEHSDCFGYLYTSDDPNDYPPEEEHVCDLSHWSYRLGAINSTVTPSIDLSLSPTAGVSATLTPTESVTPTLTPIATITLTPSPEPTVSEQKWEEIRKEEGSTFGVQK